MNRNKLSIQRIEIGVERLVLYGLTPIDSERIARAMERTILELIKEQRSPESIIENKEVQRMTLEPFAFHPNTGAERIGERVARATHGGLVR